MSEDESRDARRLLRRGPVESAREAIEALGDGLDRRVLKLELLAAGGQVVPAVLALERVTSEHPDHAPAWLALARALSALGDRDGSRAAADQTAALEPCDGQALVDLAGLRARDGHADEALAILRRAAELDGADPDVHLALAEALLEVPGQLEPARASMRRAVELDPSLAIWHVHFSSSQAHVGRDDDARRTLERGAALRPDDLTIAYLRDVATTPDAIDRAPSEYVSEYFDRFAESFDEVLTGRLSYRTPEALVAVAREDMAGRWERLDVLDAGCGTGLCGPLLRSAARRLDGVDLSAGMLAKAGEREVYDDLVRADLVELLEQRPGTYDLVLAADVLNYFGDLTVVLGACAGAVRPGGVVAFSVEVRREAGVSVLPSGRFAHHREHVLAACEHAGLEAQVTETELRTEFKEPVAGYLVAARRTG